MVDYSRYEYIKVGNFENVLAEVQKEIPNISNLTLTIHPFMDPLLTKVSLQHPEWTFIGTTSGYGYNPRPLTSFEVYEDDDLIGMMDVNRYSDTYRWAFQNNRIRASRVRRGAMETGDMKKALKIIDEYFYSKTLTEVVEQAHRDTSSHVQNAFWQSNRNLNSAVERVAQSFTRLLAAEFDELSARLVAYGASPDNVRHMADTAATQRNDKAVQEAFANKSGYVMVNRHSQWLMIPPQQPELTITVSGDALSDDIKAKLGFLKMVEGNEAIEGVGVRISPNTFYVLP